MKKQCKGITKKNTQCRRYPLKDQEYCRDHLAQLSNEMVNIGPPHEDQEMELSEIEKWIVGHPKLLELLDRYPEQPMLRALLQVISIPHYLLFNCYWARY